MEDEAPKKRQNDGEPDTTMINGRPAEEWEKPGIRERILAARAEAAETVAGIRPYSSSPDAHWPAGSEETEPLKVRQRGPWSAPAAARQPLKRSGKKEKRQGVFNG